MRKNLQQFQFYVIEITTITFLKKMWQKILRKIIVQRTNEMTLLCELIVLQVIETSSSLETLIWSVATNQGPSKKNIYMYIYVHINVCQLFFLSILLVSRSFQFCLMRKTCSSDFFVSSENTSFHTRSAAESCWRSCLRNFVCLVNLFNKIWLFFVAIIPTRRVAASTQFLVSWISSPSQYIFDNITLSASSFTSVSKDEKTKYPLHCLCTVCEDIFV